jgi:hypothetical protein
MLLIGTDEGIYRWTEGNNWPVFHGLQDRVVVGLATPGGGFLAALDNVGRVWESGNNGLSWREVPKPDGAGRPSAIAVGGTPASIVMAGGGLELYRRMMGTPVRGLSTIDFARQAAPVLMQRAQSLINRNKGGAATAVLPPKRSPNLHGWTKLGTPKLEQPALSFEIRSLTATPDALFAVVSVDGLWRTSDAGTTWIRPTNLPADVHTLRAVPTKREQLYAATGDGVWFSGDGGETWEDRSTGLEAVKHVRTIEVCPDEPTYLLAGASPHPKDAARDGLGYGLYESKDAGMTWSRVLRSFPENIHLDAIADIRFDPTEPNNAAVAFESGEMWITLNGGDYWQPFARGIRSARVLCGVG